MVHEWRRGAYLISTDKRKLDLAVVHGFLATSYWAAGISIEVVERSVEHSLAFGVYEDNRQVGFARVITDRATFAYLADVFILEPWRGKGLGTWLIEVVLSHPELQGLRRWMLATRDAHELYRKAGFTSMASPERFMEIANPGVYVKARRRVDGTEE